MSTLIPFYITVAKVPAILTDPDTRIKGVQIGDHEIKQEILPITLPFFKEILTALPEYKRF